MLEIRRIGDGVEFWVHVRPGASRDRVGGMHGDALALRVREAPREGRANDGVRRVLARALGVPARDVQLASGQRSRRKRVRVEGPGDALATRLEALAGDPAAV